MAREQGLALNPSRLAGWAVAGDGCERVIVDLSKNRSRRFCEAGCGNKANVAAYRARRTQAG